ncbi:hypothetical protein BgiBS90_031872 [Biomphalaria glabrata]|nr:hypothetical protein BgiBS90_031872 [Biomphalaria glabrata]
MWRWWIIGTLMLILFVRKASPTIPLERFPHRPPIHADVFLLVKKMGRHLPDVRYGHMSLEHKPEKRRGKEKREKRKSEEKE